MIPTRHAHLLVASATHEGMRGKNNEDRLGVFTYQLSKTDPTPVVLAVLCDGIGGHRAGEVAAELAVTTIQQAVAHSQGDQPQVTLRQGIQAASQAILEQARLDTERRGMGATCVCAWVIGDRLFSAWVGDSRLYLLRGSAIRQLTTDHTWIQEALEAGLLTPEQALKHPNQHVIHRYLGSEKPPEVDFRLRLAENETTEQSLANQGLHLQPGDRLVLCSDGLSDLVSPEEIRHAVETETSQGAPQVLVALANARGGHDNITVVLLEVPQAPDPSTAPTVVSIPETAPGRISGGGCLVVGLAVAAGVAIPILL